MASPVQDCKDESFPSPDADAIHLAIGAKGKPAQTCIPLKWLADGSSDFRVPALNVWVERAPEDTSPSGPKATEVNQGGMPLEAVGRWLLLTPHSTAEWFRPDRQTPTAFPIRVEGEACGNR